MRPFVQIPTAVVDCGSCTLCCFQQIIVLYREHGDIAERFKTRPGRNPLNGDHADILLNNPDGSCIHLVEGKCEVYDHRPSMCKSFDCGVHYDKTPRPERRRRAKSNPHSAAIYERGRQISEGRKS